jgi:hypothetical protein
MLCALTARRLVPGGYAAFRDAWDPGVMPDGFVRVVVARKRDDPDLVVTFGLFDGTLDEFRAVQATLDYPAQLARIEPFVQEVELDGLFEAVDIISKPPAPDTKMIGG